MIVNYLKKIPGLNLEKAFWRWALKSEIGECKIAKFGDQLALYTTINRETAGWRIFRINRLKKIKKVDVKNIRMAYMLF